MVLTLAQQVRLRIQDIPAIYDGTFYGDGTADSFPLSQRNQTSATAYVPNGASWSATGASFDSSFGSLQFSGVISAQSAFRARYVYSVFSEDEIGTMITAGGTVVGAAIQAVQALMFDGLKRSVWRAPDGSHYDDTAAIALLHDLYATLKTEAGEEAIAGGGIESWALEQSNWD